MTIHYSTHFLKNYKKITHKNTILKELILERIKLFQKNPKHIFLDNHKLEGKLKEYWSFSAAYDLRILYKKISGSSSLKITLFKEEPLEELFHGHVDGIGLSTCVIKTEKRNGKSTNIIKKPIKTHQDSLKYLLTDLQNQNLIKNFKEISKIGHRVVHGGSLFIKPTLATKSVLKTMEKLNHLAPLHNPYNLACIKTCQKLLPHAQNIVVFDTAFHQTIPEKAHLYGLPYQISKKFQIRRYGFHGISHQYVSETTQNYLKKTDKIISCHLGNGCSITAIKNHKAIDTSMGFTPLEGLIMGTRSGDLDPSILLYLIKEKVYTSAQLDHLLNYESGLKGIFGKSHDMREIYEEIQKNADTKSHTKNNTYTKAKLALDMFIYRLLKYIGAYTAALNGLDCLIFTGGIGENAWYVRQDVCKNLSYLGIKLDFKKNRNNNSTTAISLISDSKSSVKVLVIKTNEQLQIAKQIKNL